MILKHLAAACLVSTAAIAGPAIAIPITYDFTATAVNGVLAGQSYAGVFTVDSATVAAMYGAVNLVSFDFLGITYTESDRAFGGPTYGSFAADGSLLALSEYVVISQARAAVIGQPSLGRAMNSPATSFNFDGAFNYGTNAGAGENNYDGTFAGAARVLAVPEPAPAALLVAALFGLACLHRRRREG